MPSSQITIITIVCLASLLAGTAIHARTPLPDDFNPDVGGGESPPVIYSVAVQPDHKIVVGGIFKRLNGQPRSGLGRLNQDGSLDTSFHPMVGGEPFAYVSTVALQSDGKILVAGAFASLAGQSRSGLGRLNSDGSLDTAFNLGIGGGDSPIVTSLLVQVDGRILVGGHFSTLGGQSRRGLGRLNADGSLDTDFHPDVVGDFPFQVGVSSLVLQPGGKILVGGVFDRLAGQRRDHIGRLNPDGTLDTSFNPGADGPVNTLAVQADGKILAAGFFERIAGQTRPGFARLNPDGSLDATFAPAIKLAVWSLALQADGRILAGGDFTRIAGESGRGIARLNQDGSLDGAFDTGIGGGEFPAVLTLAPQRDGRILVGGSFESLGGQPRGGLGRLNNTAASSETFFRNGSTLIWLRDGTGPEVWRTEFDYSGDGVTWVELGEGTRVAGGWQRTGLTIPEGTMARVRGQVAGSLHGANWFVETLLSTGSSAPTARLELTGAALTLSWAKQPGTYHVQRTTSLIPPVVWQNIQTVEGGGSLSLPLGAEGAYFRIQRP